MRGGPAKTFKNGTRLALISALATALALVGATAWTLHCVSQQNRRNVALWEAVENGELFAVTSLLDEGADPDTNEYHVIHVQNRAGIAAVMKSPPTPRPSV